jgi:hypothetical protein
MGRRPTPERIYQARRAATIARLTQVARKSPQAAEAMVAAWEADAARRGLDRFSKDFLDEWEAWLYEQTR